MSGSPSNLVAGAAPPTIGYAQPSGTSEVVATDEELFSILRTQDLGKSRFLDPMKPLKLPLWSTGLLARSNINGFSPTPVVLCIAPDQRKACGASVAA